MYKRKPVIPTERSDEGSQKYRKIRDLSRSVSSLSLIESYD